MENDRRFTRPSFHQRGNPQHAILAQLMQASSKMRHVDELLFWLANVIVQQSEVQLMQFWALQAFSSRQITVELRTSFCKDSTLPQYIVNNTHISEVVSNALMRRSAIPQQSVSNYFSAHQTNLFLRYGLDYCFGHYLSSEALLPPRQVPSSPLSVPTPYSIMALLFTRSASSQELFSTTNLVLEQSIVIAKLRGFLLEPASQGGGDLAAGPIQPQQHPSSVLLEAIPRRTQDAEALRSHNPFASVSIPDKNASRLYQVIDGQKRVRDLIAVTRLNEKELILALRFLLARGIVRLYEAGDQIIDLPDFPDLS